MNLGSKTKGPDDVLPYDFDLDRWLEDDDRVTNATTEIVGGTVTAGEIVVSDRAVRVWLAGGAEHETNEVRVEVTTFNGMTKEFCLHLRISRC